MLRDIDPDPVVVDLVAADATWHCAPARVVRGYAYNGRIPGPVIEAAQGQTLVVRFRNALPEPTTIHWHGLRVPAAMDGTELVQHPVQPGRSFDYVFELPDAATFWYHPHTNETEQLEKGLYGALVVRGPDEPAVDAERVLVLDDIKLDRRGELARFGGIKQRHDGRRGNLLLLNGRSDAGIHMAAGQVERWRLVNASSSRYARLTVGGREFRILGTDGGLLTAPVPATEVLLAPADRADLAVGPFDPGTEVALEALPYSRGVVSEEGGRYATVTVGPRRPSRASIPSTLRSIRPLAPPDAPVTRTVRLGGKRSLRRGVDFFVDGEMHHHAEPVLAGELQVWEVVNDTKMDHPFHLHGFFFQVLQVNGAPPPYLSWEDTVNVPDRGRVRIAWLPDDRPGSWMYHCHILEHHAAGMMAHFEVLPRPDTASPPARSHRSSLA
jgi:FtsP/CotA-like multicopper oxidase with cupredoxin domain